MRVRFLRLSYALWLIVPTAIYLATVIYGLPHLRWSYSWRDISDPRLRQEGQGFDPFADRFYLRCTYLGPNGAFTVHHPTHGQCQLIRFFQRGGPNHVG